MPRTMTPLSSTRLSGMRGISPDANPSTTKRLPHLVARSACSAYGPPTGSIDDVGGAAGELLGPHLEVFGASSRCRRPRRTARQSSSLAGRRRGRDHRARPSASPSSTVASPTPPAAPSTSTVSPSCTSAIVRSAWMAVVCATLNAAASRRSTESGDDGHRLPRSRRSAPRTRRRSWRRTRGRRPRRRRRPRPARSTTPANSLPGTNGAGSCTWYSLATIRTSGKFTAAYAMSTRT